MVVLHTAIFILFFVALCELSGERSACEDWNVREERWEQDPSKMEICYSTGMFIGWYIVQVCSLIAKVQVC